MEKRKKTGIILIIVGLCIPLLTLPFVSGYSREKRFIQNYYDTGILIGVDSKPGPATGNDGSKASRFSSILPKKIPFRFFLIITVILVYAGIIKIGRPKREDEDN